jgi:hypothetical protein
MLDGQVALTFPSLMSMHSSSGQLTCATLSYAHSIRFDLASDGRPDVQHAKRRVRPDTYAICSNLSRSGVCEGTSAVRFSGSKDEIPNYDNGFQAADGSVHLRKPLASYSLQLPRSMAPTIRKERPVPRAQLEVRSVESFNLSDRHFNVLEGDLLDLHIQTPDGVRVP